MAAEPPAVAKSHSLRLHCRHYGSVPKLRYNEVEPKPMNTRRLIALLSLLVALPSSAASLTYVPLHDFGDNNLIVNDGWGPEASFVQATDGYLYGTTFGGS